MPEAAQVVIIVTARRLDGPGGAGLIWRAQLRSHDGDGSPSGGGSGSSTPILNESDLIKALNNLKNNDKVIIKVEGQPTIVVNGLPAGGYFSAVFKQVASLMTTLTDGSLAAAAAKMGKFTQEFVSDLVADLKEVFDKNQIIVFTNTSQTINNDPAALAGTTIGPQADTSDFDNDPTTAQYMKILFNKSKMDRSPSGDRGLSASREREKDSLATHFIHELFHIAQTFSEGQAEIAKFGTLSQSRVGSNRSVNEAHDAAYDAAAMELSRSIGRLKPDFTFESSPEKTYSEGTEGSDTINQAVQSGQSASVFSGDGNDTVFLPFSRSFVDTGKGDDLLVLKPGAGRVMWFNAAGSDTLAFEAVSSLERIAVEKVGIFTYLGIKASPSENRSATELDSVVIVRDGYGPSFVSVGGQSYPFSVIVNRANSKPDFFVVNMVSIQAPFNGGPIIDLDTFDEDNDELSLSVVSVVGIGSSSSWWFSGRRLYTTTRYNIQDTNFSSVTVRVSDGKLYQDYLISVEWKPDPNSDTNPY